MKKNTLASAIRQQLTLARLAAVASGMGALASAHAQQAALPMPCVASCGINNVSFVTPSAIGAPPVASYVASGNVGTVTQNAERAILNWQSFNIAAGNTVNFVQPSTTSTALNRIYNADPSVIRGALNANGQVYLINQNGIVFGQGAQVNTQSFIASTLNISDDVFNTLGLTGAINSQMPALEGASPSGFIQVDAGASVQSASGGRIMMFAPEILNRGSISSPDGQVILAASHDVVYLASSDDRDVRGLLVEVKTGGTVDNYGDIVTERGNTTLMGLAVNQSGRIRATTSVNLNGSVHLLAREDAELVAGAAGVFRAEARRTGTVDLRSGSVTEVLPADLSELAVDAQTQPNSIVKIMGHDVTLHSGARVIAPSGEVSIVATVNPRTPGPSAVNRENNTRVVLEQGSIIDVSGLTSAVLPMSNNELRVELRGTQFQDAPLQRNGVLRNQTVVVDAREGTPLANITGEMEARRRTLEERLAVGGNVAITSEGTIGVGAGATVDFSGGQVQYESGVMRTTQLISQGRIIDIGDADPNIVYSGIVGSVGANGINGSVGRFEQGYVEGKDAGSLSLSARNLDLDGTLRGTSTAGLHQRNAATNNPNSVGIARNVHEAPLSGLLVLGNAGSTDSPRDFGLSNFIVRSLSDLGAEGINRLHIYSNDSIAVPQDGELLLSGGGELRLVSGHIDIGGRIVAPSASVRIEARETVSTNVGDASLQMRAGSAIDVGGAWVNDAIPIAQGALPAPLYIDGGSVSLRAAGDLLLAADSRIDVSGGAQLQRNGRVSAGDGGNVSIRSDVNVGAPRTLQLDGLISGYSLATAGTLSLQGAGFHVGTGQSIVGQLTLSPDLFSQGGFANYQLESTHTGISVGNGVVVEPRLRNLVLDAGYMSRPTGSDLEQFSTVTELPDYLRNPVSLSLASRRIQGVLVNDAMLQIGRGALLRTDAGGAINLRSDSRMFIDGTVETPGGDIAVVLETTEAVLNTFDPSQAIWLQSGGRLLARGAVELFPSGNTAAQLGQVFDAGSVSIAADRGYFIAESGSVIDVSGTHAVLDVSTGSRLESTNVYGSAGLIDITVAEGAVLNGDLRGHAAEVDGASGGTLRLTFDTARRLNSGLVGTPFPTGPREIVLSNVPLVVGSNQNATVPSLLNGLAWLNPDRVATGGFESLELSSLYVRNNVSPNNPSARIRFDGDVSINMPGRLVLDAPILVSNGGTVNINAAYVALGSSSRGINDIIAITEGSGTLNVGAEHIDLVGTLATRGFAHTAINSRGDIRLVGTRQQLRSDGVFSLGRFDTAGDLVLQADQIYGSTLTDYSIAVTGTNGRIAIEGGDSVAAPLSAASRLSLAADHIEQRGTLRAPFGQISLDAAKSLTLASGSVTSTSGNGLLVPFGFTQFGEDLIYPLQSTAVFDSPPQRTVTLSAPTVTMQTGSVVDVSGGGDLLAREFLPGPGGSRDVLAPVNAHGAFAIVPTQSNQFGVFDPLLSKDTGITVGDTIIFAGNSVIPAGEYALLPPGYALLPGAFLVTPVSSEQTASPIAAQFQARGPAIVSARRGTAGTNAVESLWGSYLVETGAQVRQRSEFAETRADAFLTARAADLGIDIGRLNRDAGRLVIEAEQALSLQGELRSTTSTTNPGRGAELDIVASRINVAATAGTETPGQVTLLADDINRLGAESVLIGGTRRAAGENLALTVNATDIRVGAGAALRGPEVMLAATRTIAVESGASITSNSNVVVSAPDSIALTGDGAFLRTSTGDQVDVSRTASNGVNGVLTVAEGATLTGAHSLTLDSSRDTVIDGALATTNGSISLASSRIALGDSPTTSNGLRLSASDLAAFSAEELRLISRSTVDIYGALNLNLARISLDAAGLVGYNNTAQQVQVTASTVRLGNSAGRAFSGTANGTGTLNIVADDVLLDAGTFDVRGFSNVSMTANQIAGVAPNGASALHAAGNLTLSSSRITAAGGSDVSIDTAGVSGTMVGSMTVNRSAQVGTLTPVTDLGASLQLAATDIQFGGNIELPSGIVELRATALGGGIAMQAGSNIDVSGRNLQFADVTVGTPGGVVSLIAQQGNVQLLDGSSINVSGASTGGEAGALNVAAVGTRVGSAAQIVGNAVATERQGRFALTTSTLDSSFADLNRLLNTAGFTESRHLHFGTGSFAIGAGEIVNAHEFTLTADGGAIDVAGQINAAGLSGGRVSLNARDNVTLRPTARIDAHATGASEAGGQVELSTVSGVLDLQATNDSGAATIDVRGMDDVGAATDTGRVNLRAPRIGTNNVGVQSLASAITGAESIELEAFRTYTSNSVNDALLNTVQGDAMAYMASADAIETALGVAANPAFHLRPGIEIRSNGNLSVDTNIDLLDWRYAGEPGVLTLRSAGTLTVNHNISDGVTDVYWPLLEYSRETVQTGNSWSLRLAGGSDLNSADVLATRVGGGDVLLASNARVRTGTGDIRIASGQDIVLADATAAIYTVGINRGSGVLPSLFEGVTPDDTRDLLYGGDFVQDGGDITLRARRDIVGANGHQLYREWLPRFGGSVSFPDGPSAIAASWAISSGNFNQNVGALGGGNVHIIAGRDLSNLSAVIPTTGMPVGAFGLAESTSIAGGGDLYLESGRHLLGGVYLVGHGTGQLRAGGVIVHAPGETANVVLGLGQGNYTAIARQGLAIEGVLNSSVLPLALNEVTEALGFLGDAAYFFTYGSNNGVQLTTLAGDLQLSNDPDALSRISNGAVARGADDDTAGLTFYPGSLVAHSLQGNIEVQGSFQLYPDVSGSLELIAGNDIGISDGAANVSIILSDADEALLPRLQSPTGDLADVLLAINPASPEFHARVPVHANDPTTATIIARAGSIGVLRSTGNFTIDSSKPLALTAGQDIRNLWLRIQHADATDVSTITAGDDIVFSTQRTDSGTVVPVLGAYDEVSGPGQLFVMAASDVNLGASYGIRSIGNLKNLALAGGADITVAAGLSSQPNYTAFTNRFVGAAGYAEQLAAFMTARELPGTIDAFRALPLSVQREFIFEVFFTELRESGVAATSGPRPSNDYSRGFAAISTLFPGATYDGDIKSFLSQIATLDGGDINLIAPGGSVNAGVAAASGITKKPSELGITAQRSGDINGFANKNFLVNQSRVFALDGGDIMLWSSAGDIDAGKGAKTALTIPPPTVTIDSEGNAIVKFPAAISGSGIRGAVSTPGRAPGNVYLFAPAGAVDAGDAGIVSAGNITIGAPIVRGADNISVGGVAVGVPVETGGLGAIVAGVTSNNNTARMSTVTDEVGAGKEQTASVADTALSWLEVFVVGLGEEGCKQDDIECLKRQN